MTTKMHQKAPEYGWRRRVTDGRDRTSLSDLIRTSQGGEPRCTVAGCVWLAIADGRCYRHVFEDCAICNRERLDRNPRCDDYGRGGQIRHVWIKRLNRTYDQLIQANICPGCGDRLVMTPDYGDQGGPSMICGSVARTGRPKTKACDQDFLSKSDTPEVSL